MSSSLLLLSCIGQGVFYQLNTVRYQTCRVCEDSAGYLIYLIISRTLSGFIYLYTLIYSGYKQY